jgi:hypothetical protein
LFSCCQGAQFPESAGERYAISWGKLAFLRILRGKKRSRRTADGILLACETRLSPADLQLSNLLTLHNYLCYMVGGTGIEPVTPAV